MPTVDGPDGEPLLLHPSVLPDAPDPIEPQCLFLRAAAYLQHAVFLVEEAILKLEGIRKMPTVDGAELRLCYIENGRYGGVEIGHPDGPLGKKDGGKVAAYKQVLADENFRDQVTSLIKKSIAPHDLRPSDILIERFTAWKIIVKQLISYFEGIADIQNNVAREMTKLAGVIQVPFRSGNQFLGEGGLQVRICSQCG